MRRDKSTQSHSRVRDVELARARRECESRGRLPMRRKVREQLQRLRLRREQEPLFGLGTLGDRWLGQQVSALHGVP